MSDWKLVTEAVAGKCPQCLQYLRHPDVVIEWRTRRYHQGCLFDLLTAIAPPDPYAYSPPGADWKAP